MLCCIIPPYFLLLSGVTVNSEITLFRKSDALSNSSEHFVAHKVRVDR